MGKSRRRSSNIVKSITSTANKALPAVDKGLKTVGKTAKDVASTSIPVIEKGVSAVYGTMATGLDLGVKGVKSVTKTVTRGGLRRSRKMSGGRRSRRHRSRRRH